MPYTPCLPEISISEEPLQTQYMRNSFSEPTSTTPLLTLINARGQCDPGFRKSEILYPAHHVKKKRQKEGNRRRRNKHIMISRDHLRTSMFYHRSRNNRQTPRSIPPLPESTNIISNYITRRKTASDNLMASTAGRAPRPLRPSPSSPSPSAKITISRQNRSGSS